MQQVQTRIGAVKTLPKLMQPRTLNRLLVRFQPDDDSKAVLDEVKDDVKEQANKVKAFDLKAKVPGIINTVSNSGSAHPDHWLTAENYKVNPLIPAFTRRRELFAGRLAMLGFFAACFWELFPGHPNITQQIVALGVPATQTQAAVVVLSIIAYNTIAALGPGSPTWSKENQKDLEERPKYLSYRKFGFTKINELFQGRVAMLGFLGVFLNQLRMGGMTGPGPLAQAASILNIPVNETYYSGIALNFLTWAVFATLLAYANKEPGDVNQKGVP